MASADTQELILWAAGGVFSVLFWLLRQKDAKQEKAIDLLFGKHDDDAKRLQDLELDIARKHYVKEELDSRFRTLEASVREGLISLEKKIDRLIDAQMSRSGGNGNGTYP